MPAAKKAHITVLLDGAVDALLSDVDGYYVDGTFGRGGHSGLVLERLSAAGHLLAIDKDTEACAVGHDLFDDDPRFEMVQASFADLESLLRERGQAGKVSGVLLDLGVSSPQLDDAERGFSFLRDGPLDMRMDTTRGLSAAQWIAVADEAEIAGVIKEYGEEKFARRMAKAIVEARAEKPITRTGELADIVAAANPAWEKGKHPATRAFQAIRIFLNRELDDLRSLLDCVIDLLAVDGRLVVISFHSLEDRIVKRFIRGHTHPVIPRGLAIPEDQIIRRLRNVGKALKASAEEVEENPRSRSAVMRVAEKVV